MPLSESVHNLSGFESVRTLYAYDGSVRQLLHALKFFHYQGLSSAFSSLLLGAQLSEVYDFVVPIPSTRSRLRSRGFNPVDLIFESWVRERGQFYRPDVMLQTRNNTPLFSKGRSDRFKLVSETYAVTDAVVGAGHVLIVDDILTSGATITAAKNALLSAGVQRVSALCFAKS